MSVQLSESLFDPSECNRWAESQCAQSRAEQISPRRHTIDEMSDDNETKRRATRRKGEGGGEEHGRRGDARIEIGSLGGVGFTGKAGRSGSPPQRRRATIDMAAAAC